MNIESTELKAVEEVTKIEESVELISFDDLDLVAGGAVIGSLQ